MSSARKVCFQSDGPEDCSSHWRPYKQRDPPSPHGPTLEPRPPFATPRTSARGLGGAVHANSDEQGPPGAPGEIDPATRKRVYRKNKLSVSFTRKTSS